MDVIWYVVGLAMVGAGSGSCAYELGASPKHAVLFGMACLLTFLGALAALKAAGWAGRK